MRRVIHPFLTDGYRRVAALMLSRGAPPESGVRLRREKRFHFVVAERPNSTAARQHRPTLPQLSINQISTVRREARLVDMPRLMERIVF